MTNVFRSSSKLQSEVQTISVEGQKLIDKYGSLCEFFGHSDCLVVVDAYVCEKGSLEKARNLAIQSVLEKMLKDTPTAPTDVWNTKVVPTPMDSAILQLPKVESLFNYSSSSAAASGGAVGSTIAPVPKSTMISAASTTSASQVSAGVSSLVPSSFPVPPPPIQHKELCMASPPPSLVKPPIAASSAAAPGIGSSLPSASLTSTTNGGGVIGPTSSSFLASGMSLTGSNGTSPFSSGFGKSFGGIGSALDSGTTIESLNKRLQGLSQCNADLMKQIAEKDKQLDYLKTMISPKDGSSTFFEKHLAMEKELRETKAELEELRNKSAECHPGGDGKTPASTTTESQLIIQLQQQLESEKLNVRNLRHQIEIERNYSTKLTDNFSKAIGQQNHHDPLSYHNQMSSHPGLSNNGGGLLESSLGLQGLLLNMNDGGNSSSGDRRSVFSASAGTSQLKSVGSTSGALLPAANAFTSSISSFPSAGNLTNSLSLTSTSTSAAPGAFGSVGASKERAGSLAGPSTNALTDDLKNRLLTSLRQQQQAQQPLSSSSAFQNPNLFGGKGS